MRTDQTLACWPAPHPRGPRRAPAAPAPAAPAPAAAATAAPTARSAVRLGRLPAAFGAGGVFTVPSNRACVSRRHFRIRVRRQRAGVTLVSAAVAVNGNRVAVRKGARLTAPVDLRGLPRGRFTVRISALTADGRAIVGARRYRTCAPKKASGESRAARARGVGCGGASEAGRPAPCRCSVPRLSTRWGGHAHPRTLSSGGTASTFT